jgi:outer membrane protein assembly factor BamB
VGAVALSTAGSTTAATQAWPMFQHDRQHTGRTSLVGPPGTDVLWTFPLEGKPGTPVVAADGTIYLPAGALNEFDPGKGFLYAINPNGTQKWRVDLPGPPASTAPAVGLDGTIYVHMNGGEGNIAATEHLWAVNPDGTSKWKLDFVVTLTSGVMSSPAIAADGTVWVGSPDTYLFALNPANGSLVCGVSPSASSIDASPAIAPDGTVYVIDASTHLFAIEPDCDVKWDFQLSDSGIAGGNEQSPAVAADGTVWAPSIDDYIYAVNPNGTQKCRFATGWAIRSAPAIALDGTVYVASDGLYALNPADCTQKWRFAPFGSQFSSASPIVDGDGNIYTPLLSIYFVYSLTPAGVERWSLPVNPAGSSGADPSGAIGVDGVLYQADGGFGGSPKRLRAIYAVPKTLTVTKAGGGAGAVTSNPAGIDCGSTCSHAFAHGTSVTLTATAGSGSSFSGWSGDCSGAGTCTLTMSANHSVTALFESDKTLTISKTGNGSGSVISSPSGIDCGATCSHAYAHGISVTLTAAPVSGSIFAGWAGACSGSGTCTLTMSANRSATANFQARCIVPNVKRKTLAAAKAALTKAHCSLGRVKRARSKKKKGTVIAQNEPPGKKLAPGAKVNLVLSKGKK